MTLSRLAYVFGSLAALAIAAATLLSATGHPVPDFIPGLALAAVSALAGVAIPTGNAGPAELAAAIQTAMRTAPILPSPPYAEPVATAPIGSTPAVPPATP